jgi:hypothetical protein
VEIWLRGRRLATHARRYEPFEWVRDPAHFEGLFRSEVTPPGPSPSSSAAPRCPLTRPLSVYAELVEGGRP